MQATEAPHVPPWMTHGTRKRGATNDSGELAMIPEGGREARP